MGVTGLSSGIKFFFFGKGGGEILWGAANVLQNKLTRAQYLGLYTLFSAKAIYIRCIIFSLGPLYSREYSRILRIF